MYTMHEVDEFTGLIKASASSADETTAISPPQLVIDTEAKTILAFKLVNVKHLRSLVKL